MADGKSRFFIYFSGATFCSSAALQFCTPSIDYRPHRQHKHRPGSITFIQTNETGRGMATVETQPDRAMSGDVKSAGSEPITRTASLGGGDPDIVRTSLSTASSFRVSPLDESRRTGLVESEPSRDTAQPGANVVTIAGKRYLQRSPAVLVVPAWALQPSGYEVNVQRHQLIRSKQVTLLLTLSSFLCFFAAYSAMANRGGESVWRVFVYVMIVLGIMSGSSAFVLSRNALPDEDSVRRCSFQFGYLLLFLLSLFFLSSSSAK